VIARALLRALAPRLAAGTVTAVTAFLLSIPYTGDPLACTAISMDVAAFIGWPALLAADAIGRRNGGAL